MSSSHKETLYAPLLVSAVFALTLASRFLPSGVLGIDENPYLSVVVMQLIVYALPTLFYSRIKGREFTPKLRLKFPGVSKIIFIIYSSIFLISGSILISVLMYNAFPNNFSSSSVSEYAAFAMNSRFFDGLYLIVAFAILPAFTEEFLFRGVIIAEYDKNGAAVASLISAVMFAMSHFSFARFPVYFFAGIVLSIVLFATRSVVASAIVHTVYNAVILLCEKYILHLADKQNVSFVLFEIIVGAVTILSAMLVCYEAYAIYKGYAEQNVESEYAKESGKNAFTRIAETFFSPTFLILVIIFIVGAAAGL